MRNETRHASEQIAVSDFSISVGVSCLCQESSDLLRDAALTVRNPQIRQTLSEIAQSRASLLRQIAACSETGTHSFGDATELIEGGRSNYQQIKIRLEELSERELMEAIYLAEVRAAQNLRESVKAVSNVLVACLLSSAVATFQMSSDKLRTFCAQSEVRH